MSSLSAILRELIPADETAGVETWLGPLVLERADGLDALLERIGDLESLPAAERQALLQRLDDESDPAFARLVEAAHEAFYADPRSWAAIGYATHLPARP